MHVAANTVVKLKYTLKNEAGEVVDTTEGRSPFLYLHGTGAIVAGLEKALEGKAEGDSVEVRLTPEEGYGVRDESRVRNIPLRKIRDKRPQPGQRYPAEVDGRMQLVQVESVRGDYARIDANHPLAGMTLHFQVEVVGLREATPEEIAHGHVHGEGGHQH